MKDAVKSVVAITLICLVVAAALGVTNHFTKGVIEKENNERTEEALNELIETKDGFDKIDLKDYKDLPETLSEAYVEKSGKGYVFKITTKGYDSGLVIMCAVSPEGKVLCTSTLSNNETPTIGGSKVIKNEEYTSKYEGTSLSDVEKVEAVTGATVTSKAYNGAVKDALNAFKIISK